MSSQTGNDEPELNIRSILKCTKLDTGEFITCISGTTTNLFIGTSSGNILNVKKMQSQFEIAGVSHVGNDPINQIVHLSALEILLVICGNILFELNLDPASYFQLISTQRNITNISLNAFPTLDDNDDPFCAHIALSTAKTINLCRKTNGKLNNKSYLKINCNDVVKHMVYSGRSVCFATSNSYFIHDIVTNQTIPLFPIDDPNLARICLIDSQEFLLFSSGLAMIVNTEGISTRPPLVFHENVESVCYKSPNIYLLGEKQITIYSKDDVQMDQSIENTNELQIIEVVEGKLFVCSNTEVFSLAQSSFMNRVNRLIAQGFLEKALEECEAEYQKAPQDSIIEVVKSLQKELALQMIDEANWNNAYEYLISGCVNPLEVIKLFDAEELLKEPNVEVVEFLKQYLSSVHRMSYVDQDTRKQIDIYRMKCGIFIDVSKWTAENHLNMAQILKDRGDLEMSAHHLIVGGQIEDGLKIWENVQPSFEIIKDTFSFLSDESQTNQVLHWILNNLPDHGIRYLDESNLSLLERADILQDFKNIYKDWLIKHSNNSEIRAKLLLISCEEVETDNFESRKKFRSTLFHFLENKFKIDAEVKERMKRKNLTTENQIIEMPSSKTVCKTLLLLLEENDCDSAEKYVDLYADEWPNLMETLFSHYKSISSASYRMCVIKYLNRIKNPAVIMRLMDEVPDDLLMLEISNSLKNVVAHKIDDLSETYLTKAAQHNFIQSKNIEKNTKTSITISENARCGACNGELELNQGTISYLPSGHVVHTNCIRYPGLCPVTNLVYNA
ncbi:unnamed protein product [Caenorhabditis angaria]|uniref:CNH domain-containing protein n=1 Tax=Caenorhabditis angaria TaxID=860376 RepID=A0A9P1N8F9_9PELO|nr:unnamed protein product [Caenorhabditis angaria]